MSSPEQKAPLDTDWITLVTGEKVYLPRLPSQEEEADGSTATGMDPRSRDKGFHLLDKVRNAWGSTAGAGSDFFNVYRKQRAREVARQEQMDREAAEEEEATEFQARRNERIEKLVHKQSVKQAKRKRRKQAAQIRAATQQRETAAVAAARPIPDIDDHAMAGPEPKVELVKVPTREVGGAAGTAAGTPQVTGPSLMSSSEPGITKSEESLRSLLVIRDEEDDF